MRRLVLCLAAAALPGGRCLAGSCEDLASLVITHTAITAAAPVPAGPFSPVQGAGPGAAPREFPAFCRVTAVARPIADSEITIEIWLPPAGGVGR
jgi:feruloyl esterase